MINVLYLIGPSNSGKDYFKNLMIKNFGFVPIIPFTTRPKRKGEVDGVDYYFFDNLSDINTKEGDIVEMRSYNMVNNDSISTSIVYYGFSINPDDLDKTKDYIMCGTLESYANLNKAVMDDFNGRYAKGKKQTFPSVKIIPIFIETDSDTRYHKAMGRAMETGENIYEIQKRFDADSEDFSFKNRIKFPALYEIYNSYDPDMNDALTSVINNIYQNHKFVDPTEKEELPSLTTSDYQGIKLDNSKLNLHLGIIGRGTIGTQLIKYIKNHGENVFNRVTIVNNHHIGEPSTPKECGNFIVLNTQNLSDLNNCDIIIECINEDREKKISLFEQIDDIAKKECIFLTTSSSYSISELGKSIHHSLIGFHVFNPMEKIRLVEMPYISGTKEYFDRYQFIIDIAEKLELEPMRIDGSVFGSGIVNPILMAQINTACNVSKFVHCDIIDSMMKNITGCNMGPLETADLIGLDVCLDILEHLEINDETYHPSDVLKDKVKKGHLGRKSGLGFYKYQKRE